MYKLYLAFRFFFLRPINWVAVLGIAAAVWLLTVVPSVMDGFVFEQRDLIRGTLSDVLITAETPDGQSFHPYEEYEKILKTVSHVEGSAPRIRQIALLKTSRSWITLNSAQFQGLNVVEILGVDIEREKRASKFDEYLRAKPLPGGQPVIDPLRPFKPPFDDIAKQYGEAGVFYAGRDKQIAVMAEAAYRFMGLQRGERITLQALRQSLDMAPLDLENLSEAPTTSKYFYLAGSLRTGEYDVEIPSVYMDINKAREILDFDEVKRDFTEIGVKLKDYQHAEQAKIEIAEKLFAAGLPFTVQTWEEQKANLLRAVRNETNILNVLISATALVAMFIIYVILYLMVTTKTKDIGVVAALGGTRWGIASIFLGVGFFIAVFGEILGGVVGYYTVINLTDFELWLREKFGISIFEPGVYVFDTLPAIWSWSWFFSILAVIFVTCLIASLIPAVIASLRKPVEALRYE